MTDQKVPPDAVEQALQVLNEALALEPEAISDLMFHRVRIGRELADHQTIQCRPSGPDSYEVSALGLINGLFGADENDWGFIYTCGDTDTNLRWIPCSFLPVGKTNPATVHPQGYPSPAHNPK